jgi:CRP/FNR family cyclic AMP-dependent transcriptional regulator
MGTKRELAAMLADVTLFSRCTERDRRTIARHTQLAELPAGTDLVCEGEVGDALFLIIDGEAVVTEQGDELRRVGPGSYFGELALLDGGPRSATVSAVTDVRVAVLGIRMFRTLLREIPDLAEQLLVGLAAQLRQAYADRAQVA